MNSRIKLQFVLALSLALSTQTFATSKALFEAVHGHSMIVEYQVLNSGSHVLLVKKAKLDGGAVEPALQVVSLKIGRNEALNVSKGFQCFNTLGEPTYAVVSKKRAREKGEFQPERAWSLDISSHKLVPIVDAQLVRCRWEPDGDGKYDFH